MTAVVSSSLMTRSAPRSRSFRTRPGSIRTGGGCGPRWIDVRFLRLGGRRMHPTGTNVRVGAAEENGSPAMAST